MHDPVRRRLALQAVLAGAAALTGTGLPGLATAASTRREARHVDGIGAVDEVLIALPCTLVLTPSTADALALDAEPQALRRILTTTNGRQLRVEVDGRLETAAPIRLSLSLRALRRLDLRAYCEGEIGPLRSAEPFALRLEGGGQVRLAALQADSFDVALRGAGRVSVAGGRVQRQRIAIQGDGHYEALALDCDDADVTIAGQGELRLAAARRLGVQVAGVGHVGYRGRPEVQRTIQGVGTVEPV